MLRELANYEMNGCYIPGLEFIFPGHLIRMVKHTLQGVEKLLIQSS
jgi:hypothetical protein